MKIEIRITKKWGGTWSLSEDQDAHCLVAHARDLIAEMARLKIERVSGPTFDCSEDFANSFFLFDESGKEIGDNTSHGVWVLTQ
jgi:hypothetical protein